MNTQTLTPLHTSESQRARARFETTEGAPFATCDWVDTVWLHFEVDPRELASVVPYPLDLWDGRAFVSLVFFRLTNLCVSAGGRAGRVLKRVPACQFVSARTYVRHQGEHGICFLAEMMPTPLGWLMGRQAYGVPVRTGTIDCRVDVETVTAAGSVTLDDGSTLAFTSDDGAASRAADRADGAGAAFEPALADTLDAFFVERYSAFMRHRTTHRVFRIWHRPWERAPLAVRVTEDGLLRSILPTVRSPLLIGADLSPGVRDIWMGRPTCINGPACGTVWPEV